jgi:rhodanese-related sulfurtransferase
MTKHVLLFLIVMSILLAGCQSKAVNGEIVEVTGGSYQSVTPDGLNTMLKDKDFILINVHIPFAGNITGTDISIPYDEIEQNLSQLPAKDATIVLYCRSGRMSQIAVEKLVSLGYTNIWNLSGGMADWEQTGFDLEQ